MKERRTESGPSWGVRRFVRHSVSARRRAPATFGAHRSRSLINTRERATRANSRTSADRRVVVEVVQGHTCTSTASNAPSGKGSLSASAWSTVAPRACAAMATI